MDERRYEGGMKTSSSFARIVLVTAVLGCMAGTGIAGEEEDSNSLPAAVQKTAREVIGKAPIHEVEPAFANGRHGYEVEFKREGKEMAIVVSPEGKLLQTEERMSVGDAPEKIAKAVLKLFPDGKITHIKSVEIDGVVHFEISVRAGGHSHAIQAR